MFSMLVTANSILVNATVYVCPVIYVFLIVGLMIILF